MARWFDIKVPGLQSGRAIQALIDSQGEIPGMVIDYHDHREHVLSLQVTATAAELRAALEARGITVTSLETRLDHVLTIPKEKAS